MKKIEKFKNKQVLIVGLAVSGYNAAQLLLTLGAKVTVNDYKDLNGSQDAKRLEEDGVTIISGGHPLSLLDSSIDYIVKNPGIPYTNPLVKKAKEKQIPILTEIELAYLISSSPIIALTGTNGKTTTTKMIEALLSEDRKSGKVYAVGNIGTPASLVAQQATVDDDTVMEVSSFQLMGIESFQPKIAVITNIYSAHLDYHKTREEYVSAKLAITKNQRKNDFLIYNSDQSEVSELVLNNSEAQLIPFSRKVLLDKGVCVKDEEVVYNNEKVLSVKDIKVPGNHNLENVLAAVAVAKLKGMKNETIKNVFKQFKGVPHRMQYVDYIKERSFYNDSKATNTLATIHALEGFKKPVILLAGGLDRGETFKDLIPVFSNHLKALITFGETADKLASIGEEAGLETIRKANTVVEATKLAYGLSEPEDIVILSPACASWDQFDTFEERGNVFINQVSKFK